MSTTRNLTQMINRERSKINNFGTEPKTKEQIIINENYKKTISDEDFVLYDSGESDPDRL
ncbi:unnamed protein product, partial [Brachionus calyciflorus]